MANLELAAFDGADYEDMDIPKEFSLFEDSAGNLLTADEVDEMSAWEIEEKGIHLFEEV
jgi:hypothetical protein